MKHIAMIEINIKMLSISCFFQAKPECEFSGPILVSNNSSQRDKTAGLAVGEVRRDLGDQFADTLSSYLKACMHTDAAFLMLQSPSILTISNEMAIYQ